MDISKLSEQQKSQLLAKARGWRVAGDTIIPDEETQIRTQIFYLMGGNLYLAPNMALAWDIHLWMLDQELNVQESPYAVSPKSYLNWWKSSVPWMKENVQQLFLNKILSLIKEE